MGNRDEKTVAAFAANWGQRGGLLSRRTEINPDARQSFENFFSIFPLDAMGQAEGFDLGCGSGRIARFVAPLVGRLHCIDPASTGIAAARKAMEHLPNVAFHLADVDHIPLAGESQDFGYALGVLHHIPDTAAGLRSCVGKLKPGAPFLLYLYYSFDNQPAWFRALWKVSDLLRRGMCRLPFRARRALSDMIALLVYWPLSRAALLFERAGGNVKAFPLSAYRRKSVRTLRGDSLDRFGTRLEQRFSRAEIEAMMIRAGLEGVRFREGAPYWVAIGWKSGAAAETVS